MLGTACRRWISRCPPPAGLPQRESDVTGLGADALRSPSPATSVRRHRFMVQRYDADGTKTALDLRRQLLRPGQRPCLDRPSRLRQLRRSLGAVPKAGGDRSVWFQLYDAVGARVTVAGDPPNTHHLIDDAGSINQDIQVAVLQDGSFVVAYVDNGWDVAAAPRSRRRSSTTTERSTPYPGQPGAIAGEQLRPTVTVLSNGYFRGRLDSRARCTIRPTTRRAPPSAPTIHGLHRYHRSRDRGPGQRRVANVRESTFSDGDGNSVRSSVEALARATAGRRRTRRCRATACATPCTAMTATTPSAAAPETIALRRSETTCSAAGPGPTARGRRRHDTASYYPVAAGVTVGLAAGTAGGGDAAGDTLNGIESSPAATGNDTLAGDVGANKLQGWGGDDVLRGGAGADALEAAPASTPPATTPARSGSRSTSPPAPASAATRGRHADRHRDPLRQPPRQRQPRREHRRQQVAGLGWRRRAPRRRRGRRARGRRRHRRGHYYDGAVGVTVNLAGGTGGGGDAPGDVLTGIENVYGSHRAATAWSGTAARTSCRAGAATTCSAAGRGRTCWRAAPASTPPATTAARSGCVSTSPPAPPAAATRGRLLAGIETLSGSNLGGDTLVGNDGANALQGWGGNDELIGAARIRSPAARGRPLLSSPPSATAWSGPMPTSSATSAMPRATARPGSIDANAVVGGNQAFSFIGTTSSAAPPANCAFPSSTASPPSPATSTATRPRTSTSC